MPLEIPSDDLTVPSSDFEHLRAPSRPLRGPFEPFPGHFWPSRTFGHLRTVSPVLLGSIFCFFYTVYFIFEFAFLLSDLEFLFRGRYPCLAI
ncbi:hypothetical protein PISMIDRAFT_232211 [Pisolithus microcarpus 441]|uniref:Uncharacterized protein n=1 Tax=Pisolithus microcarpus 441 TaxID=765257 RepID=A0A0C9YT92_9AGAM|nr:hypothetical protein PISMIDRAFT_232211 [Pisolithus microcarpus 441]